MKKTIAFDMDDVLAANAEGFVAFTNERWGTHLQPEDYEEHWAELWGVDHEEYTRRCDEFHGSGVIGAYRHFDEATHTLEQLQKRYRLVIVTSRRRIIEKETLEWLDRHFKGIFDEIHFAGIWDNHDKHAHRVTKGEICQQIGADYLVDDQLKHCQAAAGAGLKAVLYGNYGWNQTDTLPKDVTRAHNWQEVLEYFERTRS